MILAKRIYELKELQEGSLTALQVFECAIRKRPHLIVPQRQVSLQKPEDYQRILRVSDSKFIAFTEALTVGDKYALAYFDEVVAAAFIQSGRFAAAGFSPYTDTFNSGSGTATSPAGAGHATPTSWGGGGGGGQRTGSLFGGGGGGGGKCVNTSVTITGGTDAIGYSVGANGTAGASANGTDGGTTTTSAGTGGFSGIAHSAGGGVHGNGGASSTNGTGGVASGGTTNTNGSAGSAGTGGASGGGDGAGGAVGDASPTDAVSGSAPGGGGGGGSLGNLSAAANGGSGRFQVAWAV